DVVLEDDDHHQDDRAQQGGQEREQSREARVLRDGVEQEEQAEARAHLHRARSTKEKERAIDDVRNDEQIDRVDRHFDPGSTREKVKEAFEHQVPPRKRWKTSIACAVARTSCTRRMLAPARAAKMAAAIDPPIRSPALASLSKLFRKDFRLAPIKTGC